VKRRLKAQEPLYFVEADLIRKLAPDLLIAQVHCDVCAVTPSDITRAGCSVHAGAVVSLSAGGVAGIFDDIRNIARAIGRDAEGVQLIARMQQRIEAVRARVRGQPAPSVIVLEWTDPVFVAGNWGPELVEAAGAKPLVVQPGQSSAAIRWDRVVEADPDVLIVAPCGFDLDRSLRETPVLESLPGWFGLTAVRSGRVAFADGNKFFNRSGTTIVETVEILAEILHGDLIDPRWHGDAWCAYHSISRQLEPTRPR
jgi:iron complex transport system substrate-binding protein